MQLKANKRIFSLLLTTLALSVWPLYAQQEAPPTPKIDYSSPQKCKIADIKVTGADNYEDFVLIGFSGLEIGETIEIPGEAITNAIKRFWRQGLFADVEIVADKIEKGEVWLTIALTQRPRVSEVKYHGLRKSEIEDLEIKVGIVRGNQITPNVVDRAKTMVTRYMVEKGFNDTEVNIYQRNDPEKEGFVVVDVEVDKKRKTKVNAIYVTGNKALTHLQINRAMKKTNDNHIFNLFRTKKFVAEEFENDKQALIEKYNEFGYRDAYIVADSVVHTGEEGRVDVYLTVDEGDKYYFRNVNWVGNTVYPYDYLDAYLGVKKGDIYNSKHLTKRLHTDEDAVSKLYSDRGYLFVNVDPVEVKIDGDSIDLEMRIYEGKPATINEINIVGNTRVYEHVVRRELHTKPGQLYSQSDIMRSLREIAQMGHFDQEKIEPNIQPNPEDGTVDISYMLQTKSSDQVEFSLGWGPSGIVGSLGLKFSNFAARNLFKPETYRIVPQGEGQTFSINGRTNGIYYNSASISFLEPWLGGKRPNSLSASIYYAAQTGYSDRYLQSYNQLTNYYSGAYGYGNYGNGYQQNLEAEADKSRYLRTLGVSLGYGKRLKWPDDYFTFYAELGYQLYMMNDWQYLFLTDGVSHNLSLNLVLSRSSIDNPIYTRHGSQFSLGLKITPPYSLLSGKDYSKLSAADRYKFLEYHKWKFSAKTFTPLTPDNKLVLMARAEFGYLGHFNKNIRSPFETYYMGGDGMSSYNSYSTEYVSMRGYTSGSLTPYDRDFGRSMGYVYNKFTMELRFPISLEQSATIWALAFVEAGNSFSSMKEYNPFNLKRSAGVGARIFLPMFGIMGIDWAYGFDKIEGGNYSGSQFHFVLGQEL